MRSYGTVHTRFWVGDTAKKLSDQQKLLFLYFLTCPHSNPIGCYRLPLAYIASDLRWPSETVTQTVSATVSIGLIEYDFEYEIVWIKDFLNFNQIANPNVAKSCIQYIDAINSKCVFYHGVIESLKPFADKFPNGYINGLLNGIANRMPNIEPILNLNQTLSKPNPKQSSSSVPCEQATSPPATSAGTLANVVDDVLENISENFESAGDRLIRNHTVHPQREAVRQHILKRLPALKNRNASEIDRWFESGADLEQDILPAIDHAIDVKGTEINSFRYFTTAIETCVNVRRERADQLKRIEEKYAAG